MPRDLSTRTDPEALGAWLGEPPPDVDDPAALALGMERVYPTLEGRNIDCDWCDEPIYFDGEGRDLRPLYHHAAAGVNVCGKCLDDPATVAELSRPPDLDDDGPDDGPTDAEWQAAVRREARRTGTVPTPGREDRAVAFLVGVRDQIRKAEGQMLARLAADNALAEFPQVEGDGEAPHPFGCGGMA
jgi:hypothetical protein